MKTLKKALRHGGPLAIAFVLIAAGQGRANPFKSGDLVVETYGSLGHSYGDQSPAPISLIEYSTSGGSSINTVTVPMTDGVGGSSNVGVVGEYGSNSEGNIQLSGDGQYLTFMGYSATAAAAGINASTNAANGTSFPAGTAFGKNTVSLAQSTDSNVPRVAALVDANGNVNSSTVLSTVYNTNNPRSAYSANGSSIYVSGQGDGNNNNQGIFLAATGLNTVNTSSRPVGISNTTPTRFVTGFNNNLYYSIDTSSGNSTGIWQFNGTPTAPAAATRIIPATVTINSTKTFLSPDGFYFANPNTLYVADTGDPKAGTPSDGGIQKWTFNGSTWSLQYTLTPASNVLASPGEETGFKGITGEVVGSGVNATVELFAVSYTLGDEDKNGLYSITDTLNATSGSGETFGRIETALGGGSLSFKGVSFAPVPEPSNISLLCAGRALLLRRRNRRVA